MGRPDQRPRARAPLHITGLNLAPMAAHECPPNATCGGHGSSAGLPGRQGVVFQPATTKAMIDGFLGSLAQPGQQMVTGRQVALLFQ